MNARRGLFLTCALLAALSAPAGAYITAPVQTLGQLCGSTYITLVRVEKLSKEKGVVIYRKVRDLKGQYPREQIRHVFDVKNTPQHKGLGDVPVRPDEVDWRYALDWAEVGKTAVVFSLKYDPYGDFGHTYIDRCWYATMCPERDWDLWYSIYSDAALLTRWHCGTPGQLATAVEQMLAGKTAILPTLVEGTKDDLRRGRGKIQGLKVGLQIQDFNPARDRVPGWVPRELAAIMKDLDHQDPQIRLQAVRDLAFVGAEGKPALPKLVPMLQATQGDEVLDVADTVGRIDPGNANLVPAVKPGLKHAHPERRIQAAEILVRSGHATAEVGAAAATLLEEARKDLRLRAAAILSQLGPAAQAAVPSLIKALKDPERDLRILAADTLGRIGPEAKAAVAALAEVVRDDTSGTARMRSAAALARLGPEAKAARPALEAALADPRMSQRPEVLAKIRETLVLLK